jgi:hypothetical protein
MVAIWIAGRKWLGASTLDFDGFQERICACTRRLRDILLLFLHSHVRAVIDWVIEVIVALQLVTRYVMYSNSTVCQASMFLASDRLDQLSTTKVYPSLETTEIPNPPYCTTLN